MVVKYTGDDLYNSTYASLYKKTPENTKKRPNFHQLPQLCLSDTNQGVSKNHADYIGTRKYVRPVGHESDNPLCLGLGSYVTVPIFHPEKPIVGMEPPQKTVIGENDSLQAFQKARFKNFGNDVTEYEWMTSSKTVQVGNRLPVPKWKVPNSTLEKNSDMVRYRPQRYEEQAELWQKVSSEWNRNQSRKNVEFSKGLDSSSKTVVDNKTRCSKRGNINNSNQSEDTLSTMADQSRYRKLPGYSGFVPREPVKGKPGYNCDVIFQSKSTRTFRPFPHGVMHHKPTMSNHCKAPMSRMITLVYPGNPFKITPSTMHTCINPIYQ